MFKRVLGLSVVALVLASCGVDSPLPRQTRSDVTMAAKRLTAGDPVADVERARLETTLAVLSGVSASAIGPRIAERGSVEGRRQTRDYLVATLTALGYAVERQAYRTNGENLVARLDAEVSTTETILVGAHLDSVRNAGADDNGSGSVAVLEAARVLRGLAGRRVNLVFAWFDEEELGLVGSRAMARSLKQQGQKLASVHTVDMLGWDSDKDRKIEIERPDGGLWPYYVAANERHGLGLPLARTSSGDTDHVAFRAEGFPSVGLCEEWVGGDTTPHYHSRTDTYDTVDFDFLTGGTKLLVAAVGDLARQVPAPPAQPFVSHDHFPGRSHAHPDHGH